MLKALLLISAFSLLSCCDSKAQMIKDDAPPPEIMAPEHHDHMDKHQRKEFKHEDEREHGHIDHKNKELK